MRAPLRIGALALLALLWSDKATAQCGFAISGVTSNITRINFTPLGGDPHNATSPAIGTWEDPGSGCGGAGSTFPDLTTGPYTSASDVMNVYIIYHPGASTDPSGRCGKADVQISETTGAISGATVHMWETQANGADCIATMSNLVAHEIGHVLGLGDVYGDSACNGTIMGNNPSYVSSDQCAVVEDTWYTPAEDMDDDMDDQAMCQASCIPRCESTGYSWFCPPGGDSPILFDLNDDGFALTGTADGVLFDLNANGRPDRVAWTVAGDDDAFLCRDRDGDGRIADGRELFGNSTPLDDGSKAAHGFIALAEFDTVGLGGNGDGELDARDQVWPTLLLWRDGNHDGVSAPSELITVRDAGVKTIGLHFVTFKHTDEHGNVFRYRGKAVLQDEKGKDRNAKIYDVFLVVDNVIVNGH